MTDDQTAAYRILDASANRAQEAARVVEDYARFGLDDAHLTECVKQWRHGLAATIRRLSGPRRMATRDTAADVGTTISTASERQRPCARQVAIANLTRLTESLRSLEEWAKLAEPGLAAEFEQHRYAAYTLGRAIEITAESRERLAEARLYVLTDGAASIEEFSSRIEILVTSGVHVIQLRDKRLADRVLLDRARRLVAQTRGSKTLAIMNDRPDLAALAQADGVHVGQEELSVKECRQIVGPDRLIGVSTHSLDQAQAAVIDGANYIGVGPVFPSRTKSFDHLVGLELVRQVAQSIRLPAFAIGGIDLANLDQVLRAGLSRVAVSSAICAAESPALAIKQFLALCDSRENRTV
jgi:thiamine-phosphate pyrophosphorylase